MCFWLLMDVAEWWYNVRNSFKKHFVKFCKIRGTSPFRSQPKLGTMAVWLQQRNSVVAYISYFNFKNDVDGSV